MSQATFVSDVAAAACGHWPELLANLGVTVPPRKQHGPCPACGGKDRFRLDDKGGRGTWICSQCGAGDGLDLIRRVTGKLPKDAAELVAGVLGFSHVVISDADREQLQQQQRAQADVEQQQQQIKRQKAARRAADILRDCKPGQSPYLAHKRLSWPSGLLNSTLIRVGEEAFPAGSLVVPLYNETGELVNVQLIRHDGVRHYLAGGQKQAACHRIQGSAMVAVCEGYATGLSVHLATGATVYCAMDAGNLLAIAQVVRGMEDPLQPCRLWLAADNDATTTGNPGKTKAEQAAAAVGAVVALPPTAGDWNDYHQANGLEETKRAIMSQIEQTQQQGASQKEGPRAEVIPLHSVPDVQGEQDQPIDGEELPEGYEIRDGMLYVHEWVGSGQNGRQEETLISPELRVVAETSDEAGYGQGRLLEWQDRAGRTRQWAMPVSMLVHRGGQEALASLLNGGLPFVNLKKLDKLAIYLMMSQPERRVTCVERTGWHGKAYVLPGGGIGPDAEQVILQSAGYLSSDFTSSGELADWQRQIAAMAVGNSRLCFALSLAFAAPLLSLVGLEGGGFHLKGESTDGKSTIMKAAASIYGQPDRYCHTWRATGNAIEGIASRRNDALLCLDELGELDGREAGQVAYMLANGQGKGRSKQDGELKERKAWRLLFLSTGELSLEDHAAEAGKRTQAGMEVRTIQIPSSTGKHGAFEELHNQPDGRSFTDALNEACKHEYGTAFRAYIETLATGLDAYKERLKAEIKRLAVELTPAGAGNQVGRAINRFAIVAAAGELATELGITGWPQGEATRAVRVCLKAWLDERGHLGNKEDKATLEQVRGFVVAHQNSRFADWFDHTHRPANMVGYRKKDTDGVSFIVLPSGWKEITIGRDPKRVAQLCLEAGYLLPSNDGKRVQRKIRLRDGSAPVWIYMLTERVLADEADGPEDE
ncbi:DUF927 domain-containing protein [Aeromonas veronii bv. sobria]|uniref:RNA helicase n=1 Tax=Aeromonas veronii TaxID=654 RepID=A0ABY3MLV2_AERVE|nr:DUF927 domain-containing protein [Aeromonas veronii]RDU84967.1 RNA helicase [Aeromonas veronii]RDU86566.1 RNA helicase [Aeromonas veronii]TEY49978.1 RNA helicase [Aeromonas veronii]TEY77385.1 RNA helicase [Aeromonas veronii]TYD43136.1 RNA helicase [Aeromonas veronii]